MITLRDIRKSYAGQVVLDVPQLELPARTLTAIVGPNGAGKSTLFGVASRLTRPDGGTVEVAGHPIHTDNATDNATDKATIARLLAVMRQDNHLPARLSVVDLVRFGRFPHCKGRLREIDHRIVGEALDYLELAPLRDRYLDELSGGQRQRAFIAMALAQDTDYVLLDEPLNNLDIRHSVAMMRRLRDLVSDLGKSVALVLHDINFAAAHADHIVAMREGRVVAQGTPDQIITPEVLREVYDVDVRVLDDNGKKVAVYFG